MGKWNEEGGGDEGRSAALPERLSKRPSLPKGGFRAPGREGAFEAARFARGWAWDALGRERESKEIALSRGE